MIEDALRTKLLANSQIAALIADRMYVLQAPQAVSTPYVVYFVVSNQPIYSVNSINDDIIIQYSVFAPTYAQSRTIANLIRTDLDNYFGTLSGISIATIQFNGIGVQEKEKESQLAHISYDFRIILN